MLAERRDHGNKRSNLAWRGSAWADPPNKASLCFLTASRSSPNPPWELFGVRMGGRKVVCKEMKCQ